MKPESLTYQEVAPHNGTPHGEEQRPHPYIQPTPPKIPNEELSKVITTAGNPCPSEDE